MDEDPIVSKPATTAIQDLYPDDFAHCFGCGRHNSSGHQLKSFVIDDLDVVAHFLPSSQHISVPGFVYGGLLASLVDCHAMATAAAAAEFAAGRRIGEGPAPRYVTASLHVEYLKPTPLGVELEIRGRVKERSERKAIVTLTVSARGNRYGSRRGCCGPDAEHDGQLEAVERRDVLGNVPFLKKALESPVR
jgi:acyl-coenzyme A thioesterase PaaI-like protein